MDGKAQSLAAIGGMGDSTRVTGCDLFNSPIIAGSLYQNAGFGGSGVYWKYLTPGGISTRLSNLEELFQYYAIRKLRIIYSPEVPTSTAGSLAIGVAQDVNVVNVATPTQQQLMELTPAFKMPVWMTGAMEYTHSGTALWETSTEEGGDPGFHFVQLLIGCTLTGSVASTQYGTLWLEYVIDFYKPSMVLGSPARKQSHDAQVEKWRLLHDRLVQRAERKLEFKDSSPGDAKTQEELKKRPVQLPSLETDDYLVVTSTPRVPSDGQKSEREASVERKPVVTGGPRIGLFR